MTGGQPTTLTDPILRLAEYWLSARLMHEHVHDMRKAEGDITGIEKAGLWPEFQTYLAFWLSSLYVVAEGFLYLKLDDKVLNFLIDEHFGSLRLYRNATFHFQLRPDKHVQFHSGDAMRLNWAEDLHTAFEELFMKHIVQLQGAAAN